MPGFDSPTILSTTSRTEWTTEFLPNENRGNPAAFTLATLYGMGPPWPFRAPAVLQLKTVTSFERTLQVNASRPPLGRSRPSISAISDDASVRFLSAGFFS